MRLSLKILAAAISVAAVILGGSFSQSRAQERSWRVEKSSGHVWVARPSAQKVSLTKDAELNPGDSIRTGSNGRVLLVRGEERIVISPNSEIGIPAVSQDDSRPQSRRRPARSRSKSRNATSSILKSKRRTLPLW